LRKAAASAAPVSTSVLMSLRSFATAGFEAPFMTISKDWSKGTPAFIIVASWRVKSAMSLAETLPPHFPRCFLTLVTRMPWRRSVALTTAWPPARISPRITLPALSLPSQTKVISFAFTAVALAIPDSLEFFTARAEHSAAQAFCEG
jgi:hypothetical protein